MYSKIYDKITDDNTGCLAIIGIIFLFVILLIIFNAIAVWLWGIIAVGIFGLPALGFWQMFGLKLLLGWIFPKVSGGSNGNG